MHLLTMNWNYFSWSIIFVVAAGFGYAKVTPATLKEFGYMAIVYDLREAAPEYCCSGILITNKIVLSTCECIGSFSHDSSLNLVFTPIVWQRYIVRLGFDGRGGAAFSDHSIMKVEPYYKCSFSKALNFTHNLGAITLTDIVGVGTPLGITLAPSLLETSQEAMESRVLEMIYNEEYCTVVGFGSVTGEAKKMITISTKFVTFLQCSGKICFNPTDCLKNVDIAHNEEMCASARNESDNMHVDHGSPMLCSNRLTGIVKHVSRTKTSSPLLLTRLGGAMDYFNHLRGTASRQSLSSITLILLPKMILSVWLSG